MRKRKTDLLRDWLKKARHDFLTAKNGLNAAEPFTDTVCLHAQQAAEKYLKAYLVWEGIEFPKTHAFEDLAMLAAQREPGFLRIKERLTGLTPYAVETCYPAFEEPLLEDVQTAINIDGQVKDFVLENLPKEVKHG